MATNMTIFIIGTVIGAIILIPIVGFKIAIASFIIISILGLLVKRYSK